MKNFLILCAFLCGIGFLIYWLWTGKTEAPEPSLEQIIAQEEIKSEPKTETPEDTKKIPAAEVSKLDDVEIAIDDTDGGLILQKLYSQEINQKITKNEVKDVDVYDGVLTFSEKVDGHWNFKAINLDQYIEKYLKK